jgi:tetratricopeptide (TPR) repeat protein
MPKEGFSWQEVLRSRGSAAFVGRDSQLELFRENLRLPVSDPHKLFIFNVWGNAGVGKTLLLHQLRRIAEEYNFTCAYIDESIFDPAEAMAQIADQLVSSGARLRQFTKRYETYREHQRRLLADPGAPAGLSSLLTKTAVTVGVRAARGVPFVGVAAGAVDESLAAEQVDRLREFIATKIRSRDDVELMMDPLAGLTPQFVRDLNSLGAHGVVLFIDTYERTAIFLDDWLRSLFSGRYGDVSGAVSLVVAGQFRLDRTYWERFAPLIADISLDVFSEQEARQLISGHGITDARIAEAIVSLSGCLPVLVDMLAREYPGDVSDLADSSETAVERFLKWVSNRDLRELALAAVVARTFNRDTVSSLVPDPEGTDAFSWLISQPFVRAHADGYRYHEVVRGQMLRLLRRRSPDTWRRGHKALVKYHRSARRAVSRKKERWEDISWTTNLLEEFYHRLCLAPDKSLPGCIELALRATALDDALGNQWAAMLGEAATDTADAVIAACAHLTSRLLSPSEDSRSPVAAAKFDASGVKRDTWAAVLFDSADDAFYRGQFERAIRYATQVVELSHDNAEAFVLRGAALANTDRFDDAFSDFDQAIQLDPACYLAFFNRGFFDVFLNRHDDALDDLGRAIELNAEDWLSLTLRGETYGHLGRTDEALADFDRALQLESDTAWVLTSRGRVLAGAGRFEESLADFGRAIEIDPAEASPLALRAGMLRLARRLDEALADVDRAIATSTSFGWAFGLRGEIYRAMGDFGNALADIDRALEIDPDAVWWMGLRGLVLMLAGRADEAQPVLQTAASALRAPQHVPWDPAWLLLGSAVCYALLGEQQQAHQCWEQGRQSPDYPTVRLVYLAGLTEVRESLTITRLDALMESLTTDAA